VGTAVVFVTRLTSAASSSDSFRTPATSDCSMSLNYPGRHDGEWKISARAHRHVPWSRIPVRQHSAQLALALGREHSNRPPATHLR
jgi:hypothetical protein